MQRLAILGCTGSVGTQALSVAEEYPQDFKVVALCAKSNVALVKEQARSFKPEFIGISDKAAYEREGGIKNAVVGENVGELAAALESVDTVVIAIDGIAALKPLLAAIKHNKRIAIANKESIVCGGAFLQKALNASNARLCPVDSEQSAIFQCLLGQRTEDIARLILTASGGPFLNATQQELRAVTPEMALKHPNWRMGKKLTVDCATLANKGLEVIEAMYLFNIPAERIDVIVHPQSIIHSMVEMNDGSVLAQLGATDMRLPILYALTCPGRAQRPLSRLDFKTLAELTFHEPDTKRFPMLALAYESIKTPGASIVYNGANDVAVRRFLAGEIGFMDIPALLEDVLGRANGSATSLDEIFALDARAREAADEFKAK